MAFGFPAHAHGERHYDSDPDALTEAVARALSALEWLAFGNWNGDEFVAEVGTNVWSWGEKITVAIDADGTVWMKSKCRMVTQCFDWGKNQRNVNAFFAQVARALAERAG